MARWWRLLFDRMSGKRSEVAGVGPRRRQAPRYAYETRVQLRCSSWDAAAQTVSGDVSTGGLFLLTKRDAKLGESAQLAIRLPDGSSLELTGKVVNVQKARRGGNAGVGIQLDPMSRDRSERYATLIEAARGELPQPGNQTDGKPAPLRPHTPVAQTTSRSVKLPTQRAKPVGQDTSPVIGIDLGTTHTSVAAVVNKRVDILEWPGGLKASPSVVSFPAAQECLIGYEARKRLATHPKHTVQSPKRLLGRSFDDPEIQGHIGTAAYGTLRGPDGSVVVEMWEQPYAVTQLCAYMLREAREAAEKALDTRVSRCVLTMPVSFDEERSKLLKRAAQMAQLDVVGLIDEPSAAALANRFDPNFNGVVGVYDFGGGTFDFSLVDVSKGDFAVLATAGDTWLGGDDFDSVLAEATANTFWRENKVDLRKHAVEWQRLRFACERAKRLLSVDDAAAIFVPEVARGPDGPIDLNLEVTREAFNKACTPLIEQSLATCAQALELVDMKPSELSCVYLSGGTTYIPAVREQLAAAFGVPVRTGVPPEHAVCLGAAMHGGEIQRRQRTTLDNA